MLQALGESMLGAAVQSLLPQSKATRQAHFLYTDSTKHHSKYSGAASQIVLYLRLIYMQKNRITAVVLYNDNITELDFNSHNQFANSIQAKENTTNPCALGKALT